MSNQSRLMSAVEAVTNVGVGLGVAVCTLEVVLPLVGIQSTLGQNALLAVIFTCVSLIRFYLVRRLFEKFR